MKKNSIIAEILIFNLFWIAACTRLNDVSEPYFNGFLNSGGVFILNEGNFMSGNGSISFYSTDSMKIYNEIFRKTNGRPLGDVPNSMGIMDDKAFIVVNNSGKIEVTHCCTMKSVAVIPGLISPRHILFINKNKAYVSSLYSTKLLVINPTDYSIVKHIELRRTSESMVFCRGKAYVSCWVGGDELMVIDTSDDTVIDSIKVGHEPESMVIDRNGNLWVLCSGSYTGDFYPELILINTVTDRIEKKFQFGSKLMYPTCLKIDGEGDTLYYIEKSIRKMSIFSDKLPVEPFIGSANRNFYKIHIEPGSGRIFATNAVDYQQRGFLLIFNRNGTVADSVRAGIIPGFMCYKR